MTDRPKTQDTPIHPAAHDAARLFGTCVAKPILASGPVRLHQQAGHMIASDRIPEANLLQGGRRPHMGGRVKPVHGDWVLQLFRNQLPHAAARWWARLVEPRDDLARAALARHPAEIMRDVDFLQALVGDKHAKTVRRHVAADQGSASRDQPASVAYEKPDPDQADLDVKTKPAVLDRFIAVRTRT